MPPNHIAHLANATFAFRSIQLVFTFIFLICHIILTEKTDPNVLHLTLLGFITSFASFGFQVYAVWMFARKQHLIVRQPRYYLLWSGVDVFLMIMWITTLVTTDGINEGIFTKHRQHAVDSRAKAYNVAELFMISTLVITSTLIGVQGIRRGVEIRAMKKTFNARQLQEALRERTLEEAQRKKGLRVRFEGDEMKELA